MSNDHTPITAEEWRKLPPQLRKLVDPPKGPTWEALCTEGDHEHVMTTDRQRWPNGWLVRVVAIVDGQYQQIALEFIYDSQEIAPKKETI